MRWQTGNRKTPLRAQSPGQREGQWNWNLKKQKKFGKPMWEMQTNRNFRPPISSEDPKQSTWQQKTRLRKYSGVGTVKGVKGQKLTSGSGRMMGRKRLLKWLMSFQAD